MSERFQKRRCIIKKLDFENCIVTNSKTTARGRKRLRARITREVEDVPKNASPVAAQDLLSSPVLLVRSHLAQGESPVCSSRRRKLNFSLEEEDSTEKSAIEEPSSPSSPVFKLIKRSRILNKSHSKGDEEDANSCAESSYQIDDFTTQESKDSVKISSVDSAELKNASFSICSVDSTAVAQRDSPVQLSWTNIGVSEKCDGRRNHKKYRILSRLRKLQKKQASEKLLWQHQRSSSSTSALKFSVLAFWKDEHNFFLKCRSSPWDPAITFLVVDTQWVPKLKRLRVASVLLLHPPWQKVTIEESDTTVLTNAICLDILDDVEDLIVDKRVVQKVPADEFEIRENLFVDSLFCPTSCGFLC